MHCRLLLFTFVVIVLSPMFAYSQALASIPVVISNGQQLPTPAPFQQMLTINSLSIPQINSNWSNVEFSTGVNATGTILQAWVEENATNSSASTIVWVKLPYSIAAYSQNAIYLDVMGASEMSASGPTGEAPQLSRTYGQYDNGANVFNFYDNFAGGALGAAWGNQSAGDGFYHVGNGLFINETYFPTFALSLNSTYASPIAIDMLAVAPSNMGQGMMGAAFSDRDTPGPTVQIGYSQVIGKSWYDNGTAAYNQTIDLINAPGENVAGPTTFLDSNLTSIPYVFTDLPTNVPQVDTLAVGYNSVTASQNYADNVTANESLPTPNEYPGIFLGSAPPGCPVDCPTLVVTWFRLRAMPPDGVMPSARVALPSNALFFDCYGMPTNPSNDFIALLINYTKIENIVGACALSGLSEYGATGVLASKNMSINITKLDQNFFADNPTLPTETLVNATLKNATIVKVAKPGLICVRWSGPDNKTVHVQACNNGLIKKSIVINVTAANSTITILPNQANPADPAYGYSISADPQPANNSEMFRTGYQVAPTALLPSVTFVQGSWILQPANKSLTPRASTQWVGIGGTSSGADLIQIGTFSCYDEAVRSCDNPTGAGYAEFFQIINPTYPIYSNITPFAPSGMKAGDAINAYIKLASTGTAGFYSVDAKVCDIDLPPSSGCEHILMSHAPSSVAAAYWIDERPQICISPTCPVANITNFINASYGPTQAGMIPDTANVSGTQGYLNSFPSERIEMVNPNGHGGYNLSDSLNVSSLIGNGNFNIYNLRVDHLNISKVPISPGAGETTQIWVNQGASVYVAPITNVNIHGSPVDIVGAAGGTGQYTYQWLESKLGGRYAATDTNCLNPTSMFCTVSTNFTTPVGQYSFELDATDTPGVTVSAGPVGATVCPALSTPAVSVSPSRTVNSGTGISIDTTETGGTPSTYTYQWYNLSASRAMPQATRNVSLRPATTTTYMVTVTDHTPLPSGCGAEAPASGQVTITVIGSPTTTSTIPTTTVATTSIATTTAPTTTVATTTVSTSTTSVPTTTTSTVPQTPAKSVAITLTNRQGSPTPAQFQQMLHIDSSAFSAINGAWTNVEFSTGANATGAVLPAWVEGNATNSSSDTVVWVLLPAQIPPGGNMTIYMDMMPTAVMSASGPTGEAPQLSAPYGSLDNGAEVFRYYDNFSGPSLGGWSLSAPNVTGKANDGLSLNFTGNGYAVTSAFYGPGTAFDADMTHVSDTIDIGYVDISQTFTSLGGIDWATAGPRTACGFTYPDQVSAAGEDNHCGSVLGYIGAGLDTGVYTTDPITSASSLQYVNYNQGTSSQPVTGDAPPYPGQVGVDSMQPGLENKTVAVQWARVRNAPPNGVMPLYAYDPAGNVTTTSVTTTTVPTTAQTTITGSTTSTTVFSTTTTI